MSSLTTWWRNRHRSVDLVDIGVRKKEITEIRRMSDLKYFDENACHNIGGLAAVGQYASEGVTGLLPTDPVQDSSLGSSEQYSPLRIEFRQRDLDPLIAAGEDNARTVGGGA